MFPVANRFTLIFVDMHLLLLIIFRDNVENFNHRDIDSIFRGLSAISFTFTLQKCLTGKQNRRHVPFIQQLNIIYI